MKKIEINNCPSTLASGYSTYSPSAIKKLFDGHRISPILDFGIEEFGMSDVAVSAMRRISVSGVQEKFPAVIDKGRIRIAEDGERSTYILKPAPWDRTLVERKQIPANENLTMQIASQVYGIVTAANGLCFTKDGHAVYITRRFDIQSDGTKSSMDDFASLVGRNEQTDGQHFKYSGSYEDIAVALKKNVAAWRIDMERFFELVVFNYIYGNGDDHLKNFSLIRIADDYRLAPAYDLLNTSLHVNGDDLGLDGGLSPNIEKSDVYERTGHPCRIDFERFGLEVGIVNRRMSKILDKYMSIPVQTRVLVDNSFLSDKMKRTYLRIIDERVKRFIRKSE
ncbi:MAG: HipA domain-containing protein [Prevotella sp.]|nr:HipA domain-containing protein [Prevotella sp.]